MAYQNLALSSRPYDWLFIVLFIYFIFSCLFIESKYCFGDGPMDPNDDRFMMPETYDFCVKYNPLFLERPKWLKIATCWSAFGFLPFHCILLSSYVFGINSARPFAFIFAGIKLYALTFYHYMEYTSHTPPPSFIPYWAAEGPYLIALFGTLWRFRNPGPFLTSTNKKNL